MAARLICIVTVIKEVAVAWRNPAHQSEQLPIPWTREIGSCSDGVTASAIQSKLQALVVATYFSSHKDTALSKEALVIGRTHIEYSFRNTIRFEIGNKIRLGGDVAEILVFCRRYRQ